MDSCRYICFCCSIFLVLWFPYGLYLYALKQEVHVLETTQSVPVVLQGLYPEDIFHNTRDSMLEQMFYNIFETLNLRLIATLTIIFNVIHTLWNMSKKFGVVLKCIDEEVATTFVFSFILCSIYIVFNLPAVLINFVLCEKTILWLLVTLGKKLIVNQLVAFMLTVAVFYFAKWTGPLFFFLLWLLSITIFAFITLDNSNYMAYSEYNTNAVQLREIANYELYRKVDNFSTRIGFSVADIYVLKNYDETNAAYIKYIGSRRIVISDAFFKNVYDDKAENGQSESLNWNANIDLIDQLDNHNGVIDNSSRNIEYVKVINNDSQTEIPNVVPFDDHRRYSDQEIFSVIVHEIGHWYYVHYLKSAIFIEVNLSLIFILCGSLYNSSYMYRIFGFSNECPIIVRILIIFVFVLIPWFSDLFIPLYNRFNQHLEYESDLFAKMEVGSSDIKTALIRVYQDNRYFPVHGDIYSMLKFTHPTLIERINNLMLNGKL